MIISTIVAVAKNGVIGANNEIPWYLPADLAFFKRTTLNHHILMGRNCYESIGKPLPKRTNMILTRDPFFRVSGCVVVHSVEEAIELAETNGEEELFIIGGGVVYEQTLSLCNRLYYTEVDITPQGDVFFPAVDWEQWKQVSFSEHEADEKNKFPYSFCLNYRK